MEASAWKQQTSPDVYASAMALAWALAVSCVVADAKASAAAVASPLPSAVATAVALALALALTAAAQPPIAARHCPQDIIRSQAHILHAKVPKTLECRGQLHRTYAVFLMLLRPMAQQFALSQLHLGREETRRQVQEEVRARE